MDSRQYARDVVHRPAFKSKKWIMATMGLACVMFTFLLGLLVICLFPKEPVPTAVVNLVGQVVTFLGALVGAYTTGQSFVDWKSQANLATLITAESQRRDQTYTEQHVDVSSRAKEGDYAAE